MSFNIFELFEQPKSAGIQEGLKSDAAEDFLWFWPGAQGTDYPGLISRFRVSQLTQVVHI